MITEGIPAAYENGAFQVSTPLPDLAGNQAVEERRAFIQKTSGIWAVEDDELLHWLAESPEASVLHDGTSYESVEPFGPSPVTVEERIAFVHRIAGIWPVQDDELRQWLDTEITMYNDELWS